MAISRKMGQRLHGATFVTVTCFGDKTNPQHRHAKAYWPDGKWIEVRQSPHECRMENGETNLPEGEARDWLDAIVREEQRRLTALFKRTVHWWMWTSRSHESWGAELSQLSRHFGVTQEAIRNAEPKWTFRHILSQALDILGSPFLSRYHDHADIAAGLKRFAEMYPSENGANSNESPARAVEKMNEEIALDLVVSNFDEIVQGPAEWFQLATDKDCFKWAVKAAGAEIERRKLIASNLAQTVTAAPPQTTTR